MRYFTKSYRHDCRCIDSLELTCDDRASSFSEELFHEILLNKLEERKSLSTARGRKARDRDAEHFLFDAITHMEEAVDFFGEEVIASIPDVRLLSLGTTSPEICRLYQTKNDQYKAKVMSAKEAYQSSGFHGQTEKRFLKLHDAVIKSISKNEDLSIVFEEKADKEVIRTEMIFKHAQVLVQEQPISGMHLLYSEVYKSEHSYEFHLLLGDKFDHEYEFTFVSAEDAKIQTLRK